MVHLVAVDRRDHASWSASCANFGEWTPTTTSTSAKRCSSGRSSSSTCRQLTQQKVQKSSSRTDLGAAAEGRFPPVLIHPPAP